MTKTTTNLYERLLTLKDPRRKQGTRHALPFMMLILIMAVMSGATSLYAIEDFAQRHQQQLYKLFKLKGKKRRVPNRKTFERLLAALDFKSFSAMFYQWAKAYVPLKKGEWLALDGKVIGSTTSNAHNSFQNFTSLVCVFTHKRGQVLAQTGFMSKKGNEIGAVQSLLHLLDLEGMVFSLDALDCQKKTVQQIVKSNNDYVIGVKKNQPTLYQAIKKKFPPTLL